MSKRSILTWLVVLAAVLVVEGAAVWRVTHRDSRAYPRAFTTITIRQTGDRCVVLNSTVSKMFAKSGDVVTWLIVGTCNGHRIGINRFRQKDPADIDPTTRDAKEPRVVPALGGQVIQLSLRPDTTGTFTYDIDVDPPENPNVPPTQPTNTEPSDDGPEVDVCHDWPCK